MVKKRGLFLVLLLLVITIISVSAETSGCYFYPDADPSYYCAPGITDTIAQEDCAQHGDCTLEQYFVAKDCSQLEQCKPVTCNIDCNQLMYQGQCLAQGGTVIEPDDPQWCQQGCCRFTIPGQDNQCVSATGRFQCEDLALKTGRSYIFLPGLSPDQCQLQCQVELAPAKLTIVVYDESNQPTEAAINIINGPQLSYINQQYTTQLAPGVYSYSVTKDDYATYSGSISLLSGDDKTQEVFLQKSLGQGKVEVSLTLSDNKPPVGAVLSWQGPISGQSSLGNSYILQNLPLGTYTLTVTLNGYQTAQQQVIVSDQSASATFVLNPSSQVKVFGYTVMKNTQERISGVNLYVDGLFKGPRSSFDNPGYFEFYFDPQGPEDHTLSAFYQGNDYQSTVYPFTISPALKNQDLGLIELFTYQSQCADAQPLTQFSAFAVPGKKAVKLQWQRPCPDVIGYTIKKYSGTEASEANLLSTYQASLAQNNFLDEEDLLWGQTYTYTIMAKYESALPSAPVAVAITLGDELCSGHYDDQARQWDSFCATDASVVLTCNDANQIVNLNSCQALGAQYYCAAQGSHQASCKDAGICAYSAEPFGLYSTPEQCYGGSSSATSSNYCFYDSSATVADQCRECSQITNCFDYESQGACEFNNCLTDKCGWIAGASNNNLLDYSSLFAGYSENSLFITPETGVGYCVEENYEQDDQCGLCGPESSVFNNFYCTADVCSALGRCFSSDQKPLSECLSCGDYSSTESNCYTYATQQECEGTSPLTLNGDGTISGSDDSCGWNRCAWVGNQCIKDGDADQVDDCADASNPLCHVDTTPPLTTLSEDHTISYSNPQASFLGNDNYKNVLQQPGKMGWLKFCLTSADAQKADRCTSLEKFSTIAYPQLTARESVSIDLIAYLFEHSITTDDEGETFILKYFSQDAYHNQEDLQIASLYIDNIEPDFEIKHKNLTLGSQTTLTVWLEKLSEPVSCSFVLDQLNPRGQQTVMVPENNKAIFSGLPGVVYDLNVTCADNQGNELSKSERYVFDLEPKIDIIYPAISGVISEISIPFQVTTDVGTTCELWDTSSNSKFADFQTDSNGLEHQTSPLSGFIEADYTGRYEVICTELDTGEKYEDYFSFVIDFTPPPTSIMLTEGARTESPSEYGWELPFVSSVAVSLTCVDDGFACDKTYYCLGESCSFINDPGYQQYTAPLTLEDSTKICYYSTDVAASPFPQITCGFISIEGFGIVLEKPLAKNYLGETWGISNEKNFTIQFYTKIPTSECRYDFISDFNYDNIPAFKVLSPDNDGRYIIEGFPESVGSSAFSNNGGTKEIFVKCLDASGEVGPEKKLNLEFDPSAPRITSASANPNPLIEGNQINLFVKTDDKSICRYTDQGQTDYNLMPYTFPGGLDDVMSLEHEDFFKINSFIGLTKDYTINIACANGAGDYSETETINFKVDYTQLGGIESVYPAGDNLASTAVELSVITSKNALCTYNNENATITMVGSGTRTHTSLLSDLTEGYYHYPLKCRMADQTSEQEFTFTIDLTKPTVLSIDDGKYSCGNDGISIMVNTDEKNITNYEYELYDLGNSSFSSFSGNSSASLGTLVSTAVTGSELPLKISSNLIIGNNYRVKVRAGDAAGNWGEFKTSEGFLATTKNQSSCETDEFSPVVKTQENSSCTSLLVELQCTDDTGCQDFQYGKSANEEVCLGNLPYNGQKLNFDSNGVICYSVSDRVGNNKTGTLTIKLPDEDGDGVLDSCDVCPRTNPGEFVDTQGCGNGESAIGRQDLNPDTDQDGLPDSWENTYNSVGCELDFTKLDSNSNGQADPIEDYDGDGRDNSREYLDGTDPCVIDKARGLDEVTPTGTTIPSPPTTAGGKAGAWFLFIFGMLLLLGGTGYLIYYYLYSPAARKPMKQAYTPVIARPATPKNVASSSEQKWESLRKQETSKRKSSQRSLFFSAFGKDSPVIPHVEEALSRKSPHLNKLQELSQKYVDHKEEIKPGLRKEEINIFNKLENIAQQTKDKEIEKVVTKEQAKDIFSKLRDLSKKRKEKK